MHYDPSNLIVAVSKACGHFPDVEKFSDRLAMQKSCYILNSWGYEPIYRYSLYIRGPYSSELADDYYEMHGKVSGSTDVSESDLSRLKELYTKGLPYVEAYATVLLLNLRYVQKYDYIAAPTRSSRNPGRSSMGPPVHRPHTRPLLGGWVGRRR